MYFRLNLKMKKPMLCCCFTWIVFIELNFTVAFLLIRKTWDDGYSTWVFFYHPWKFHFFFSWLLEFPHALSSIYTPGNSMSGIGTGINSPFQVLKFILLIKIYKTQPTFVVGDIVFYKILELHSTLPEKRFLSHFPFLTDLLKPPHPLSSQNLSSLTKFFCWCSLMFFGIPIFLLLNLII